MKTLQSKHTRGPRLSVAAGVALTTALIAGGQAAAQSANPADAARSREDATTKPAPTAHIPSGPFVYDALGATPSIRLPALFGKPTQGDSKEVAAGVRAQKGVAVKAAAPSAERIGTAAR